ncbi:hypothetical protein QCA50_020603 [Cerrena zonata]|uniref:UspA domain-containing protein n=1 Tax=Cerrena zonata TaxID=2478898 RepID=A0AAW0F8U4_9APHY
MASRQSRLEAEKLAIIQKSMSNRGRSVSPSRSGNNSRSSSTLDERFNKDLKWSITNHDPLERLKRTSKNGDNSREDDEDNDFWDNEVSEEEHISDDDDNEKFQYDDTGNILPNYACHDEKINEISSILENSNLNDRSTVRKLEQLTAHERGFANAKSTGNSVNENLLKKLETDKQALTGNEELDLLKTDQDEKSRKQKLENYSNYRKKIVDQENENLKSNDPNEVDPVDKESSPESDNNKEYMIPYTSAVEDKLDSEFASKLNETIKEGEIDSNKNQSRVIQTITRVIEIIHHPIPRHLIIELIDNLQPTLVVVGSKGQSAIKGVLLGSLSNYLVTKSTVPVMVVREKLKKINRFKSGSSIFSNNIKPLTLSEARID